MNPKLNFLMSVFSPLAAVLAFNLAGCNGDSNTAATDPPKGDFPVNESFAGELAAQGVPTEPA